ncbi:MAG: DNA polymerase III subunit beta, partial [Halanaerobiales bacterium]
RELPPAEISFNVDEETYSAHIECLNSEFDIRGLNPDEFPSLPEVEVKKEFNIDRELLKEMIDEVKFTTAGEETQPSLTGALMLVSGNIIRFVATNTYRLAYSQREIEDMPEEDISIIIPGDSLNELSHLLEGEGKANLRLDKSHVCFQFADIVLISRLIEGDFPNYEHVMPDKYNTKVEVEKAEFHQAVKRASLVAREDSNVLQLEIDNDIMIINTLETESGKAHEELEINMEGDRQKININAGYLLDVFRVLKKDTLDLELIDNINPLSIKRLEGKEVYIYLIMPIRQEDERGSQ